MLDFPRWKIISIFLICLWFAVLALPSALPEAARARLPSWMPGRTVSLGLDLQGGSHLLLELDFDAYLREQLANLQDELRGKMRAAKLGYKGFVVKDGAVQFTVRDDGASGGKNAPLDVRAVIREANPDTEVAETAPGTYRVTFSERALQDKKMKVMEQSLEIVNRRVNETGTREPTIQRQGTDRILLQVPGLSDPGKLKNLLGQTAKMTFHMVDGDVSQTDIARGYAPPGVTLLPSDHDRLADGSPAMYAIESRVLLSGDMLTDAHPTFFEGQPSVGFQFNTEGARKFAEVTSKNPGRLFAIVLDDKVITAPRINDPILGGSGVIYGHFTTESANDLALLLRAGALPAPLKVIEERSVGPSLGADSVEAGKRASILGVVLVMGFMVVCYGLFGLFANVALIVNMVILLAALSLFQATLTLPGIAGIVLTLGMAVDANVLIFERIREEVLVGKSPFAAMESGFKMAFATIMDSNITTLIAAALLYYFGTGTVKGFAVTLTIGILSSMFTAVVLTRLMMVTWLKRRRPKTLPI